MKPSTTEIRNRNMVRSGQYRGKINFLDIASSLQEMMFFFILIFSLFCSLSFHFFPLFTSKICLKMILIQQSKLEKNQPMVFINTFPRTEKHYSSFSISLMGLICPKVEIAAFISFFLGKDWTFKTESS